MSRRPTPQPSFGENDAARPRVWRRTRSDRCSSSYRIVRRRPGPSTSPANCFHRNSFCDRGSALGRASGSLACLAAGGYAMAACPWSPLVLCSCPGSDFDRRRKGAALPGPYAVQNGGEDPATGSAAVAPSATWWPAASSRPGNASPCARGWKSAGPAIFTSLHRQNQRGSRMFGCRQHHSCGKRTAFPVVMHMLSTGFNLRKWPPAWTIAVFHLLYSDFHLWFRLFFPLS